MAVVSTRIEDWLREDLEAFWRQHGEKPAPGYRRALQEWWTTQRFPLLTFRDGPAGRRAAIRGGPDVWEIELVAREIGRDTDVLVRHFDARVPAKAIEQAVAYAARFAAELDDSVDDHIRMERMLGAPASREV